MGNFLISFEFHTASDWIQSEMFREPIEPQTTSLYVCAPDESSALRWGEDIASTFMARVSGDASLSWAASGYSCWIEASLSEAGWDGAEEFLQSVRIGEYPDFNRLTRQAWLDWLEKNGDFDA
jgi:hypothetical protein